MGGVLGNDRAKQNRIAQNPRLGAEQGLLNLWVLGSRDLAPAGQDSLGRYGRAGQGVLGRCP